MAASSCEPARWGSPGQGGASLQRQQQPGDPCPEPQKKPPSVRVGASILQRGLRFLSPQTQQPGSRRKELSSGWKGQPAGTRAGATLLGKQTPPQHPPPSPAPGELCLEASFP